MWIANIHGYWPQSVREVVGSLPSLIKIHEKILAVAGTWGPEGFRDDWSMDLPMGVCFSRLGTPTSPFWIWWTGGKQWIFQTKLIYFQEWKWWDQGTKNHESHFDPREDAMSIFAIFFAGKIDSKKKQSNSSAWFFFIACLDQILLLSWYLSEQWSKPWLFGLYRALHYLVL